MRSPVRIVRTASGEFAVDGDGILICAVGDEMPVPVEAWWRALTNEKSVDAPASDKSDPAQRARRTK